MYRTAVSFLAALLACLPFLSAAAPAAAREQPDAAWTLVLGKRQLLSGASGYADFCKANAGAKRSALRTRSLAKLKALAEEERPKLLEALGRPADVRPLWIVNAVLARLTPEAIEKARTHEAVLWTRDFDETLAFYRDVLGLPLAYPSGGGWAEFRTGAGVALCLHADRESKASTEKVAVFGWRVDDLDAAVAALRAHGVVVRDPRVVTEGMRAAEFEDPSRNALFLEGR